MSNRQLRKRIPLNKKPERIFEPIKDDLEFTNNKASQNARKKHIFSESLIFNVWHEKHYHLREQLGDENGPRNGINHEIVHEILEESFGHLILYSGMIKNFTFLNYKVIPGNRNLRVVCQKQIGSEKTNVVIEVHVLGVNEFEVTIITAIQTNEYHPSDGQFTIELLGGKNSILSLFARGKLTEISSI